MACTLATAYDGTTACPPPSPGIDEAQVWFGNRADLTFTGPTANVYSDLTGDLYRWKVHNKGVNYTDTFSENETSGAGSWAPSFNFRLLGFDGATSNAVEKLRGVDIVVIFKAKNGKYIVAGSQGGLRLKTNETGSEADTLGETVSVGGDEEPGKHRQLLDTDAATTLALLVSLEA